MADALVRLNANWRVSDDPPQWAIEQRIGNPSIKDSGWRARKFIRNTDHLLKRIGEMCGGCRSEAFRHDGATEPGIHLRGTRRHPDPPPALRPVDVATHTVAVFRAGGGVPRAWSTI